MKLKLTEAERYELRSLLIRTARGGGNELSAADQSAARQFADRLTPPRARPVRISSAP